MSPAAAKRPSGYRNYTGDGTYWTVRKRASVYWVVRIDPRHGEYEWADIWGGYRSPGAAAGAAAQLAHAQGKQDAAAELREALHRSLDKVGLGVQPKKAPVKAPDATILAQADDEDDNEG